MTVKEFLSENNLTAVETVNSIIMNLVVNNNTLKCLDVDTSNIQFGTKLIRDNNFILTDTTLTANGITIDINTINIKTIENIFENL